MGNREYNRAERVADLLQHELALVIQREISLAGGGLITVSAVRVSPDLSQAKVFVTIMGGDMDAAGVIGLLRDATPMLRHLLAGRVSLRRIPRLRFVHDTSVEHGAKLSALIDSAVSGGADRK